jgi:hypothetical protein
MLRNCTKIAAFWESGTISAKEIQLDFFESVKINLECPFRLNQKDWKPLVTLIKIKLAEQGKRILIR